MTDNPTVERAAKALLAPEDVKRVEIFLNLTETMALAVAQAEKMTEEFKGVMESADVSEADKTHFRHTHAEALRLLLDTIDQMDADEIRRKAPTREMLHAYATVHTAKVIDEIRADIAFIKDRVEGAL
jgi:hypothetical protein